MTHHRSVLSDRLWQRMPHYHRVGPRHHLQLPVVSITGGLMSARAKRPASR